MHSAHIPGGVALALEPMVDAPPHVEYRWDVDTDILCAALVDPSADGTHSASVELEGADGSWLVLDVHDGRLHGVEVAVWPDIQTVPVLRPPAAEPARVRLFDAPRAPLSVRGTDVEVDVQLTAETDPSERTIHFRLGEQATERTVSVGRDILLDVDGAGRLAGLWLLNVPPLPALP
jgi:hypothetical protein